MQLTNIVATALLPLLAVAEDASTLTSTMTMTKYVTISKVATSSIYASNNTTSYYLPTGTGYSSVVIPTTTPGEDSGSPTSSSPTVSPTIDNGNGASSLSAFAFAGVAGMVVAALM
jgi:hypothetical protein